MNIIKYYILRLRDTLFPPRTTPELWDWSLKKGKYSYLSEKQNDDIQRLWRKRRSRRI